MWKGSKFSDQNGEEFTSIRQITDLVPTNIRLDEDVLRLEDVFCQDLLQRYIQDVFNTYNQVKLFLLTSLREVLQKQLSSEGFG